MHLLRCEHLRALAFRCFLLYTAAADSAFAKVLQISWRETRLNAVFDANGKPEQLLEDYILFNCPAAGDPGIPASTINKIDLLSALYGIELGKKSSFFIGSGFVQIATQSQIEAPGVDPGQLEADLNSIGCRSNNSRLIQGFSDAVIALRNEAGFGRFGFETSLAVNIPLDKNPQIIGEPDRKVSLDLSFAPSYGKKLSISLPIEYRLNLPSRSLDRTLGVKVNLSIDDLLFSAAVLRIDQFAAESFYQNSGSQTLNYVFDGSISIPIDNSVFAISYQRSLYGINAIILDSFEISLALLKF